VANASALRPSCAQVGVIYDIPLRELRMFTDYGRASRPLFIVDSTQKLLIRKNDIIKLQVSASSPPPGIRRVSLLAVVRSALASPIASGDATGSGGPE
jgi:hypothetical protein